MTARTGLFVARDSAGNGTTPVGARLALGSLLARPGASALDVREGVLYDGRGSVLSGNTDTGPMSYTVRAAGFVQCTSPSNGAIVAANDAAVKVPTTAAPATDKRIDVVWFRQHLVAGDGGADADVVLELGCTQGATAASPNAPAIPTDAVELGRATVTAGATSTSGLTITQTHLWTALLGAPIPVRSQTERDALTVFEGLEVLRLDLSTLQRYQGGAWGTSLAGNADAWTGYAPTLTTTGTAPTLGNGTLAGSYHQLGKTVHYKVRLVMGTNTNLGSGSLVIGLPKPISSNFGRVVAGSAIVTDAGTGYYYGLPAIYAGDAGAQSVRVAGIGVQTEVSATYPMTWAVNDILVVTGTYEAA